MVKKLPFDLEGGRYKCTLMETLYFSNKLLLISSVLLRFLLEPPSSGVDQMKTVM